MPIPGATPAYLMDFNSWLQPIVSPRAKVMARSVPGGRYAFSRIDFQFMPDLEVSDHSANWSEEKVLFRGLSNLTFESADLPTFTIKTKWAAVDDKFNSQWVEYMVSRLEALTKPIYTRTRLSTNKIIFGPPLCLFTYGYKYINVPVIITQVDSTPIESSQVTPDGFRMAYEVTLSARLAYPYGGTPGYLDWIARFATQGNIHSKYMDAFTTTPSRRWEPFKPQVGAVDQYIEQPPVRRGGGESLFAPVGVTAFR